MEWTDAIIQQWRSDRSRARAPGWQPHILVVDDEDRVRDVFALILESFGCHVDKAASGHDALAQLETKICHRCPPWDLTFLDLVMPGMPGDQVLKELKFKCPRIPVVIVTAYPDSEILQRASEIGYIGLILKPFSRAQLQEILEAHQLIAAVKELQSPT
jgi:two-component system response regulator (stage 0 sporulation protein F)